jgi:NAD(P)-dependent dehydrogenase (short-subunit alcohol dehydrogenase family)
MNSLPNHFKALVIGSTGSLGAAFLQLLQANSACQKAIGIHRHSAPRIDFLHEDSIAQATQALASQGPFHLIINAAGMLHTPQFMPEKKLSQLSYAQMEETFRTNAFGPALVLSHFSKLLGTEPSVMAVLSAKVGSVGDNRLGGWPSYRASKAALNMFMKTAAIELKRTHPNTTVLALHPGTVQSSLSRPFGGDQKGRAPLDAAKDMLHVMAHVSPADTGQFYAYDGQLLPW